MSKQQNEQQTFECFDGKKRTQEEIDTKYSNLTKNLDEYKKTKERLNELTK